MWCNSHDGKCNEKRISNWIQSPHRIFESAQALVPGAHTHTNISFLLPSRNPHSRPVFLRSHRRRWWSSFTLCVVRAIVRFVVWIANNGQLRLSYAVSWNLSRLPLVCEPVSVSVCVCACVKCGHTVHRHSIIIIVPVDVLQTPGKWIIERICYEYCVFSTSFRAYTHTHTERIGVQRVYGRFT